MDRYTKSILTVIAGALVYLCIVLTPLPVAYAQRAAQRPGEFTGPGEVVVVGWKVPPSEPLIVTAPAPLPVTINGLVEVRGRVSTERSSGRADRVLIAGWEEGGALERAGTPRAITSTTATGLPVVTLQK